ncbi:MAG: PIN domain-containing protein [Nanoarchaeota archaeon]|nr:PIN domain-containing protein [Nanoarchaeota archaeon]
MKLVVDTNVLVSFFRPNPVNEIISMSKSFNLRLFSPEYAVDELKKPGIKQAVLEYSGLNSGQFNEQLSKLLSLVEIVPDESVKEFEPKARQLIHDKDVPIFALALKLNCPIWSNEPRFKQQSQVVIFSNRDMIELFDAFLV